MNRFYLPTNVQMNPTTPAQEAQVARLFSERVNALNWMRKAGITPLVEHRITRQTLPDNWADLPDNPF